MKRSRFRRSARRASTFILDIRQKRFANFERRFLTLVCARRLVDVEHFEVVEAASSAQFVAIYMPRREGAVATVLSVHTSAGVLQYTVQAEARGNPYRVRAAVRAQLATNGTFEFPLTLHNPHAEKLRLVSLYSSDAEVTLVPTRRAADAPTVSERAETSGATRL